MSLLHRLRHPYVIDFIGVVLHPLCFILEWAPGGSLHSVLQKYKKMDGRISPRALQKTAYQVMYTCVRACVHSGGCCCSFKVVVVSVVFFKAVFAYALGGGEEAVIFEGCVRT